MKTCDVEGCDRPARYPRGRYCKGHYNRLLRTGSTGSVEVRGYSYGALIGYEAAHMRVRSRLGAASDRLCVDCGMRAAQWSFNPRSGQIIVAENPKPGRMPLVYSEDASDYEPRCAGCHVRFDRRRRAA